MTLRYGLLTLFFAFFTVSACSQYSDYWQQEVDYQMEIDMDVETNRFTGSQTLTYYNHSPDTLTRAFYHLYFNAFQPGSMMDRRSRTIEDPDGRVRDRIYHYGEDEIGYQKINALSQNGNPVNYEVSGTILEVTLNEPIPPGRSAVFEMDFEAQVPLQTRRSGRDNAEGVRYSMSQWYPKMAEYDRMGWHPNPYIGREFHGVWGRFDVKITIDSSYVVAGTGHLQNPDEIGHGYQQEGVAVTRPDSDNLTWHWRAENVHDFMWAADPDYTHTTAQVPDGPKLHFFYQTDPVAENANRIPQDSLKAYWERLPEYTVRAFEYMNEHFGKYPYGKYSVIQGGDGGMEYPMATLITGNRGFRSLVGVTVHELIHSWYQGVLANNESLYAWIDEGFTSYASSRTMNHLFGGQSDHPHMGSYNNYYAIVRSGMEEALDTHADHFVANRAYGVASYSKGAVFLHQLSYIIGNKTFERGMKRFFNEWKFKHPGGEDFIRVMEKESDMILDWYYEYWIHTTKTIDYAIASADERDGETDVTLERIGLMMMPIDLVVEYTDGSKELFYIPLRIMRGEKPAKNPDMKRTVLEDWPWVYPEYTLTIPRPASEIRNLVIDPSMRMADIDLMNNVMEFGEEDSITE